MRFALPLCALVVSVVFVSSCGPATRPGGPGGAETVLAVDPGEKAVEAPTTAVPIAAQPPIFALADGAIWRVAPDGTGLQRTDLPAGDWCSETAGIGGRGPLLSADARWIAWMDAKGGDLWVAETGTGTRHRVTHLAEDEATADAFCIELSDWSPDSRTLLYHVGENPCEDCGPAPDSMKQGFFLLTLDGLRVEHLPKLAGFDHWLSDSRSVIFAGWTNVEDMSAEERREAGDRIRYDLLRLDVRGEARAVLARTFGGYGLGQPHVHGGQVVFLESGQALALRAAPLDAVAASRVLVQGAFAEYQWPTVSPGGTYLAYEHRDGEGQRLEVRLFDGTGEARVIAPAEEHAWYDDRRLLVCNSAGMFLYDVDGTSTRLAREGACFVRRSD